MSEPAMWVLVPLSDSVSECQSDMHTDIPRWASFQCCIFACKARLCQAQAELHLAYD